MTDRSSPTDRLPGVMPVLRSVGAVIVGVGLFLLPYMTLLVYRGIEAIQLLRDSVETAAMVNTAGDDAALRPPEYEFTAGNRRYTGEGLPADQVGDRIAVVYVPSNPRINRPRGEAGWDVALGVSAAAVWVTALVTVFIPMLQRQQR